MISLPSREAHEFLHWLEILSESELQPETHPDLPRHDYIAFITNLPSKLNLCGPLEARVDFHLIKS